ncbi:ATP-grasp domain-containing protein [Cereibacter sphaeroides]|uniref:ATP-grasp domain-containing protein n=1 Tax=Cereibacter sphaeroides TaxID=1063 RepID=UPI001F2EA203|nr:ATP-grasp domain-containing protein [Cereibacter sphaeroides]MCE6958344.1 ATP-grasp domain-containing protein [Cereibacter sphaeroides]MCE6972211.1 ATP-grasp domain-containing protein [Cereibacter sphaeroides]
MTHVVFVDSNVPGIETMRIAKGRGYSVTFIQPAYRMYAETEHVRSVISSLDNIIRIGASTDRAAVEAALVKAGRIAPIDAVITQYEGCVDAVACACSKLGLRFTAERGVLAARDKALTRRILAERGIRSARSELVSTPREAEDAARRIGGRVVVKPRTGYDSLLAYEARDPAEAASAAARLIEGIDTAPEQIRSQLKKGILVEELLQGELVSAEIGRLDGRFHRFMISGRPRSRENECIEMGATMPADIDERTALACFDYAEAVVEALGLDFGIFHVEMILTTAGPTLVEVNPRLMGGVMPGLYKNLTGDDIQAHLLDIHLGCHPRLPERRIEGFITSRKLMPRAEGVLSEQISLDWVRSVPGLVDFDPYQVSPGDSVAAHAILARYQVAASTLRQANAAADALLDRFEREIGVELIR